MVRATRRVALFALVAVFALGVTRVDAQFNPTVSTSFAHLNAGQSVTYSQMLTFFEGEEGPAAMNVSFDKGSFDFSGIVVGDNVSTVTIDVFVDNPFPIPDISGIVSGGVYVSAVDATTMHADAIVDFVSPELLPVLSLIGIPDPTGDTVFYVDYADLTGDTGVTVDITDSGALPITGGTLIFDLPITWDTDDAFYTHSPTPGTLTGVTSLTSFSGFTASVTETFTLIDGGTGAAEFLRGDSANDGAVAINDAVHLLSYLFASGPAPVCADAADVNDDGALAIDDAINLLNYLFTGPFVPPAPGPTACGVDPTADGVECTPGTTTCP